ncbi:MAG TPA: PhoH family protein [Thermotogota bacterium]|nr:PhoH family protein [Thermotogota bacterium]HPJ90214.1 PhoH family protein [Thermotogota bacterium]HPR97407.1 PhoH family protein [Thermotogota bacterium]
MIKNYVLDTNVLLHDPSSIFSFEDNTVVIPLPVLEELDGFKRTPGQLGANCREVVRVLDTLRKKGDLIDGIELDNGGKVKVLVYKHNHFEMPPFLKKEIKDNWILAYALRLLEAEKEVRETILVTKDINFRLKADSMGIPSQDYMRDKSEIENYKGYLELDVKLNKKVIAKFEDMEKIPFDVLGLDEEKIHPNLYISVNDRYFGKVDTDGEYVIPIEYTFDSKFYSINALNKEQLFALDAMMDDSVKLVTLVGPAGTGKTLLALAAGLKLCLENKVFEKMIVTKPVVPMGKDIGYIPGSAEDKLRPWVQPIFDNLEFLFGRKGVKAEEYLKKRNLLDIEVLSYIRGRSIPDQLIIIDETQNLTPHEIKTIITRVGENSKIILTGDPEQIDNPYLDEMSNGLMYAASRFYGESIAAHVHLTKGERSELASIGSVIL